MKNTKTTKHALLSSFVALFLCVAMLAGTTFAWFTDSVSSGVNTIVAGNLDIELEYSKNGTDWSPVNTTTDDLFSDVTLWEPGATSVVYLRLSNKGSLDLKYRFSMAIASETQGTNVNGNSFKLSDYIQFSFIEGNTVYTSRDAALAAAGTGTVLSAQNEQGRAHDEVGTMNAGAATRYFALVVFMPETVGNVANYKKDTTPPTIKLGLNLIATQLASENDSFDNQYDGGANWNGDYMNSASAVVNAPAAGQPMEIVLNNNAPVSQTKSTALTMASVSDALAGKEVKFTSTAMNAEGAQANFSVATGDATEVAALKLEMAVDGVATSDLGGTVTITTYIQTGLTNVGVTYVGEGAQPTNVQYDPSTGKLSFDTTHFSDYVVTAKGAIEVNGETYGTLAEAIAANEGGIINITGPVVMFASEGSSVEVDMKGVTIDGGNNANLIFRNVDGNGAGGTGSFGNMTLKNLSVVDETYYIYENGENAWEFTYLEFSGTNTFENVIFTDGVMAEGVMSTFTGCTFIGHNNDSSDLGNVTMYGAWVTNGSATFTGCTFTGTRGFKVSEKYNGNDVLNVTVDGCTFDNLSEKPGVAIDFYNVDLATVGTADIIIKNSEFIKCKPGDQGLYIYETDNLVPTLENNTIKFPEGSFMLLNDQKICNGVTIVGNGTTSTTLTTGTTPSGGKKTGLVIDNQNVTIKDTKIKGSGFITSNEYYGVIDIREGGTTLDNVSISRSFSNASCVVIKSGVDSGETVTLKNSTFKGGFKTINIVDGANGTVIIDNCEITGIYTFNVNSASSQDLTVKVSDSKLHGWTSYGRIKEAVFVNTEFSKGTSAYDYLRPYADTTLTNCTFDSEFLMGAGTTGFTITLNNCVKDGVKVTAENIQSLVLDADDMNNLRGCTIIVDGVTVTLS